MKKESVARYDCSPGLSRCGGLVYITVIDLKKKKGKEKVCAPAPKCKELLLRF